MKIQIFNILMLEELELVVVVIIVYVGIVKCFYMELVVLVVELDINFDVIKVELIIQVKKVILYGNFVKDDVWIYIMMFEVIEMIFGFVGFVCKI